MKSLTYATIATLDILVASKNLVVTWQGTHNEFMKLITKTNMSCQDLNIHKSKEAIIVTHESKMEIAYFSMVLATNEGMPC
jgi:hypothetical protein